MKLSLQRKIIYEVVAEQISGQAICTVYRSYNPRTARSKALSHFCDLVMSDYPDQAIEPFVRVYVHHPQSGKRFEIINTDMYAWKRCDFSALHQELQMYRAEKIQTAIAIHHARNSGLLSIYESYKNVQALNVLDAVTFLADDYWLFTRIRKVNNMTA